MVAKEFNDVRLGAPKNVLANPTLLLRISNEELAHAAALVASDHHHRSAAPFA